MDTSERVIGVVLGVTLCLIGINTLVSDSPTFSVRDIITVPAVRWVGWPCVFCGLAFAVTNIRGFYTDRKKHLADIARCKLERQREAEAAKSEES